jgi:hypothetical protein
MNRSRERGEGRLGSVIGLLVLAWVVYLVVNVGPAYFANYALKDKMNEVCRTPKAGPATDDRIAEQLWRYVREEGLDAYIARQQFQITTLDTSRRISLTYEREVRYFPGMSPKVITFVNDVDQPLVF